jgi:hypothetical protein
MIAVVLGTHMALAALPLRLQDRLTVSRLV